MPPGGREARCSMSPRGVSIAQPLHMLSAFTRRRHRPGPYAGRAGRRGRSHAAGRNASPAHDAPGLHLGAIELVVKDGARLRYVNLQNWSTAVWHFAHQRGLVERDARAAMDHRRARSRLAKVNQHVALVGPGARTQVNGVMFTEGRQHLSYHTLQHHQPPTARATCFTRRPCRTNHARSGGA